MIVDAAKVGVLIFFVVLVQVTMFSTIEIFGGTADLVLVTLVAIALLRGSIFGAGAGFAAGLVVVLWYRKRSMRGVEMIRSDVSDPSATMPLPQANRPNQP